MKIMNLHGFLGKADNRNYQALRELLPDAEIISPKLDFLHDTPAEIRKQLFRLAVIEEIDLIVGQSLGAAYGLRTAWEYAVPCILTNPCLEPAKTEIIANSELSREILSHYEKADFKKYFAKAYILLSDRDEIISNNPKICLAITPHVKVVSGTHSSLDNLKNELGALLKKLETPESRVVTYDDRRDKNRPQEPMTFSSKKELLESLERVAASYWLYTTDEMIIMLGRNHSSNDEGDVALYQEALMNFRENRTE